MDGLLVFGGIVVLIIVSIVVGKAMEKKRKEGLTEFFLDLSFNEVENPAIPSFKITSRGRRKTRYNNYQGNVGGRNMSVFDYRFVTGHGKHKKTHLHTIAMTNAQLPVFELYREGFFSKLADKFTSKDIDFHDFPEFSDSYVLAGDDEESIRQIFTPKVLSFFEDIRRDYHKNCHVESNGRELIFCIYGKRIKPDQMGLFVEKSQECFGLFG